MTRGARVLPLAVLVVLLISTAANAWLFQRSMSPALVVDYDVGVHMQRSIRAYHVLRDPQSVVDLSSRLHWAGILGNHKSFPELDGNHYPPLVYLLTGGAFGFTGPSIETAMAMMIPFAVLLVLSAWGLAQQSLGPAAAAVCAALVVSSPTALAYTHTFMLDLPLATMSGCSLWMLAASADFQKRPASLAAGLALGLGSLIKPTFILFAAGPVAWQFARAGIARFPSPLSRAGALMGTVAAIGYLYWMSGCVGLHRDASLEHLSLLARGGMAASAVMVVWCCARLASMDYTPANASRGKAWTNCVDAVCLSLVLAAPWNIVCAPLLGGGLFDANPAEPSGIANIPAGTMYYLWSLKNDLLLFPAFLLMAVGAFVAFTRSEFRQPGVLVVLSLLGMVILAIHGGRLTRYVLPVLVPAAWLASVPIASLPRVPRRAIASLLVFLCVGYSWTWLSVEPSQMHYGEWGRFTTPRAEESAFLQTDRFPFFKPMAALPRVEEGRLPVPQLLDALVGLSAGKPLWVAVSKAPGLVTGEVNLHDACLTLEAEARRVPIRFTPREEALDPSGTLQSTFDAASMPQTAMLTLSPHPPKPHLGPLKLRHSFHVATLSKRDVWIGLYLRAQTSATMSGKT